MKRLLVGVAAAALSAGVISAPADAKPLPPLDIQIVKVTKNDVVVKTVCPNDPPARIYVYTTSPSRQLAITEPVTCLRTKSQRFVIPLNPGVTLRKGQHLGETWVTFSGDSGEMNNVWDDVVVGERLPRGELFPAARAAAPKKYKNCTAMNRVYPHGVGKRGARDHTTGTPVTNFTRNAAVYRANTARDGDKDGIACEKR